jgi:hypothetical protein
LGCHSIRNRPSGHARWLQEFQRRVRIPLQERELGLKQTELGLGSYDLISLVLQEESDGASQSLSDDLQIPWRRA